jgi:hypothetical protein
MLYSASGEVEGEDISGARVLPKVSRRLVLPRTYYIFIISDNYKSLQ